MIEQEWLVHADLERMVAFVEGYARPRKSVSQAAAG
jgi:hypothetical protein